MSKTKPLKINSQVPQTPIKPSTQTNLTWVNWESVFFSREVICQAQNICLSLCLLDGVKLYWFFCPAVRLSCCPAVPFLVLSFKPVSQRFAPFYYGHCVSGKPYVQQLSGFCWSKHEGNNQRGRIIPITVPKTAHIPTPPAFIIFGRLRADLRSAERLAVVIFGDLSPAQWTCQSSSRA